MDGLQPESEIYVPTLWARIEPALIGVATLAFRIAFAVGGLAAAYLLFGVLSGGLTGFNSQPVAERHRVLANLVFAGGVMRLGLGVGSIGLAVVYYAEESVGYFLLLAAAATSLGVPYICRLVPGGQGDSYGVQAALFAFIAASYIPAGTAGILIARDIVLRLVSAIRNRPLKHEELTYGSEAIVEKRPIRTSLLAKCWEGPYCREFIRSNCPIFLSRKACWREKKGCYCEEEIVSAAANRVTGIHLEMAPDSKYNFANAARPATAIGAGNPYRKPELSHAQKVQRCKYCVIYNEHEREKYNLLVPMVMIGTVLFCALAAPSMRGVIAELLHFTQGIVNKFTFDGTAAHLTQPDAVIEWVLVGAFTVIVLSKILQALEWMCFKAKI